jgi:membrane protein YdbS with pleckstrin-like domain
MQNTWKKQFIIVGLIILFSAVILFSEIFQDQPAVDKTPFIFIFIAYVTLFPLIITHERPRFSRCVYQYNHRAPPVN